MRGSKNPVLKNFFRKLFLRIIFFERYSMRVSKNPVLKNFFRKLFLGIIFLRDI
jgi:hypothetical protein